MTELLLRIFVRDYRNSESTRVHASIGKLAAITGIICNILLFAGKLVAGLLSGVVSIVADAVNNLSDASSSVITLLGFRMAQQPADKDHPYGHARYEYISALAVAVLILVIGGSIAKSSVEKILHPQAVDISVITFAVVGVSIGVKIWMAAFYASLGRRIHSVALRAASADSRNDVVASAAVLTGCMVERIWYVNADGYIGLGVAVFILLSGLRIAGEAISPLLGKRANPQLIKSISEIILSRGDVLGMHDLLVHDYGPGRCFASVHVELSCTGDVMECHEIIDSIERDVHDQLHVHLVVHFDPVDENDTETAEMRIAVEEIIREIDSGINMHDFRILRAGEKKEIVFDLEMPYAMMKRRGEIRAEVKKEIAALTSDYDVTIRFDGVD